MRHVVRTAESVESSVASNELPPTTGVSVSSQTRDTYSSGTCPPVVRIRPVILGGFFLRKLRGTLVLTY